MIRKIAWYATLAVAAVFLVLVALGFNVGPDTAIPPGVDGRHVSVDGVMLRVAESGNGDRSVILLHGMLGSIEDWETVIPLLESRYRVIAVDRPGHGYSAEARETNNLAFNARVVQALMKTLDLDDTVVVGHSYGGSIALQLVADNSPGLRGVVLVAPGGYPDFPAGILQRFISMPLIGRGATRALIPLVGERRIRDGLTAALGPDVGAVPKNFFDLRVALWMKPVPLRSHAEHAVHFNADLGRLVPGYPKISRPVLILQGEADSGVTMRAGAERLAREIPGATLRMFPATGHYLQYRQPQAVAEAVDQLHGVTARGRIRR